MDRIGAERIGPERIGAEGVCVKQIRP